MRDMAPINQWLAKAGFEWVSGQERLYKNLISFTEALDLIEELHEEGAIRRVSR